MTEQPDKPKPRRRWLQFRLRTLLLLVLVLCGWLAWMRYEAREQREAVEWVREMGGSVTYDYEMGNRINDAKPSGPPLRNT